MENEKIGDKIKRLCNSEYFVFFVFFLVTWALSSQITLRIGSDDTVYQESIKQSSIFRWVYQRAVTWQPRIFSDLSLALVNFNMPLWSFLNAGVASLGVFTVSKMSKLGTIADRHGKEINILICCLFFFIYPYVITSAVLWYTGSFHYLWPVTAMLIAMVPFYYAVNGATVAYKNLYPIIFFASIYACYTEQTIAILVCFGVLALSFLKLMKKKIPKLLVIQYIVILLNSTFFFVVNNIGNRELQELHWYPDYKMLTIVDRVFQGVNLTNSHYINSSNILFLFLTLILFIVIRKKYNHIIGFFGAIPMLYMTCNILPFDVLFQNFGKNNQIAVEVTGEKAAYSLNEALNRLLYNINDANPSNYVCGWKGLIPAIFGFTIILFIAILIYVAFDELKDKFTGVILYLAALASGYAIGFSPTIFASGSRIFYIGNILIILICSKLLHMLSRMCENEESSKIKCVLYIVLFITAVIICKFFTVFTGGVLWL